jgi:hypothetical protein
LFSQLGIWYVPDGSVLTEDPVSGVAVAGSLVRRFFLLAAV